jgi:hypothetical protein
MLRCSGNNTVVIVQAFEKNAMNSNGSQLVYLFILTN